MELLYSDLSIIWSGTVAMADAAHTVWDLPLSVLGACSAVPVWPWCRWKASSVEGPTLKYVASEVLATSYDYWRGRQA